MLRVSHYKMTHKTRYSREVAQIPQSSDESQIQGLMTALTLLKYTASFHRWKSVLKVTATIQGRSFYLKSDAVAVPKNLFCVCTYSDIPLP